jgi:hypothetical protein
MYSFFDWCEAGYQFGRLRENWNSTPFRLFIRKQDDLLIDMAFRLLYLKLKNKVFLIDELESFYNQMASLSAQIDEAIKNIP